MAKKKPPDTWKKPPFLGDAFAAKQAQDATEDAACRKILTAYGVQLHAVRGAAGAAAGSKTTFAMLCDHANFPREPAVAGPCNDTPGAVLAAFDKTQLWVEWVTAWDLRPDVPKRRRALVFKSKEWGYAVLHDDKPPTEAPHVVVTLPLRLTIEPLLSWVRGLAWSR